MFKRLKAHILCELYLLFCGMWRGECKMTLQLGVVHPKKIIFIGTVLGSIFGEHVVVKTFYSEPNVRYTSSTLNIP